VAAASNPPAGEHPPALDRWSPTPLRRRPTRRRQPAPSSSPPAQQQRANPRAAAAQVPRLRPSRPLLRRWAAAPAFRPTSIPAARSPCCSSLTCPHLCLLFSAKNWRCSGGRRNFFPGSGELRPAQVSLQYPSLITAGALHRARPSASPIRPALRPVTPLYASKFCRFVFFDPSQSVSPDRCSCFAWWTSNRLGTAELSFVRLRE
jgi:hypothetical protein